MTEETLQEALRIKADIENAKAALEILRSESCTLSVPGDENKTTLLGDKLCELLAEETEHIITNLQDSFRWLC